MEPTTPMGASLRAVAVAVDGGCGNGVVPAAVDNNEDTMASAAMASLTGGGGGVAAMVVVVIDCAAVVDAATTILLSLLTAVAKTPLLPLPSPLLQSMTAAMAVVDSGDSGSHLRRYHMLNFRFYYVLYI